METTNPVTEVEAVAAMESLLGGPDEVIEEQEEVEEEPQQEATDEAEEATEEAAEPVEEYEEINWNGETRKLTKTEVRELAQKGFDYTHKTQQLADARRQFEAQAQVMQQSIALQNAQIETVAELKAIDAQLAQFNEINWMQLADSDPMQYLKLNQTFRDIKEARQGKIEQFQQQAQYLTQQQERFKAQMTLREMHALADAVPEFKGEKATATREQIKKYLRAEGYNDQEIGNVFDHRAVKMAWKAAQWDALQASKPALTKRAAELPKVVKPSVQKPANTANKDAMAMLKKTGRMEHAAKLIESML